MDELLKKIKKHLELRRDSNKTFFDKQNYEVKSLVREDFISLKETTPKKKFFFIDGGNQDVLFSNSYSLSYNKVCAASFEDNKRRVDKKTFFVLSVLEAKDEKLTYQIYSDDESLEFFVDANDSSLSEKSKRANPQRISSLAREVAEISYAKKICDENTDSVIVLDGVLLANNEHKKNVLESLYLCAAKNNNVVCAVAKTSGLVTSTATPLSQKLSSLTDEEVWAYELATSKHEFHKATIYLAKLHPRSKHAFRFEILRNQKSAAQEVLSGLLAYSKDPVFYGYPYGLIVADDSARVSNHEVDVIRTKTLAKLRNDSAILSSLREVDAHQILDNIKF
ncbi:DNA double-strand break repair nuclease NurA [Candidatus Woesearchaeota archaeon]|nr:DNA double-strand break repair nuclease NurA [Candidatus Woesearchaeota archaeon]